MAKNRKVKAPILITLSSNNQEKYSYQDDLLTSALIYSIRDGKLQDLLQKCPISHTAKATPKRSPRAIPTPIKARHQKSTSVAFHLPKHTPHETPLQKRQKPKAELNRSVAVKGPANGKDRSEVLDDNLGNTAEHSFIIPNIRKDKKSQAKKKSTTKEINFSKVEAVPQSHQKELHGLRLENAELRKEFAEKSRERTEAEKVWIERNKYAEQLHKLLESKVQCIDKQEDEIKKRVKLHNQVKTKLNDLENKSKELTAVLFETRTATEWCEDLFRELLANENTKEVAKDMLYSYGVRNAYANLLYINK